MKTLYLKPAEGRLVRDPATKQPIPAWGVAVPAGPYWNQLRRDGDVVETDAKAIEEAEAKAHADARAAAEPPVAEAAPEPPVAEAAPEPPVTELVPEPVPEPAPAAPTKRRAEPKE